MTQAAAEKNPTEVVLDVCRAIAAGENRREELATLVEQRHREMNKGYAGFVKAIESRGEAFEQTLAQEIAAVENFFNQYHESLNKLKGYIENPQEDVLTEAMDELKEAAAGFRYAMKNYDDRFLSLGSSQFPLVNYFRNLAKHLLETGKSHAIWEDACDNNIKFFASAVEAVDASPDKDKPHMPQRRKALVKVGEVIAKMRSEGPQEEKQGGVMSLLQTDDSSLTRLADTMGELQDAVDAFDAAELAAGPTSSPRANMFIRATEDVRAGKIPPQVHQAISKDYLDVTQKNIEALSVAAGRATSDMMADELAKLLDGMEGVEEAVTALLPLGEGQTLSDEDTQRAVQTLTESMQKADNANKALQTIQENSNKLICPSCSHANPQGALTCQKCHMALPSSDRKISNSTMQFREGAGGGITDDRIMTVKMKALFNACDAYDKGDMSAEEFSLRLDVAEADLKKARATVANLELPQIGDDVPEEHVEFLREARELGAEGLNSVKQGIRGCWNGLEILRSCVDTPNRAKMEEGIHAYFEGGQEIMRVFQAEKLFLELGLEKIRELTPEIIKEAPEAAPTVIGGRDGDHTEL